MKIWNDKEVKKLFDVVENAKKSKKALSEAFCKHAQKYGRKQNSVRNYYYHEIDNLIKDSQRCKKLEIDISKHQKAQFVNFNKMQEEELFESVEKLVKDGVSVRSACLKLSNGNLVEMTRLQNKYQNMKKKLEDRTVDNIIPFKQVQKSLSDSDINSLFLGLVKLIKKTAVDDYVKSSKADEWSAKILLRKTLAELSQKDSKIVELIEKFEMLKEENRKLSLQIKKMSLNRQDSLKEHILKNNKTNQLKDKRI